MKRTHAAKPVGIALMISLSLALMAHFAFGARPMAAAMRGAPAAQQTPPPSLRIYGDPQLQAGEAITGGRAAQPYLGIEGLNSLNNPEGRQAPRADLVTWNPVWMWDGQTVDENQQRGLYDLIADGKAASEQVWFRHWYDPAYPTVDARLRFTPTQSLSAGTPLTNYPALVQEFTYMLQHPPSVGRLADPGSAPLTVDIPAPFSATVGNSEFIFPVSVRADQLADLHGYGLTSFDADFDGTPDKVEIHSENSLRRLNPPVELDFENDSPANDATGRELNPGGEWLSGNELLILSLPTQGLARASRVHFFDYMVEIRRVGRQGATLLISYTGGRTPKPLNFDGYYLALHEVWTSPAQPDQGHGPFFVQVLALDPDEEKVSLRVGRALGVSNTTLDASEPHASLKHFYVDGHEYQVVAIIAPESEKFLGITLRTALPVIDSAMPVDSVVIESRGLELQNYLPEMQLAVLPPYNQEHYILTNVRKAVSHHPSIGEAVGGVAPLPGGGYTETYTTTTTSINPNISESAGTTNTYSSQLVYQDSREMRFYYRERAANPSYQGNLRQLYAESTVSGETGAWEGYAWATRPDAYLELVMPDIQGVEDYYLLSSVWPLSATANLDPTYLVTKSEPIRLHFVYDPATSNAIYQTPQWVRLYGLDGLGAGNLNVEPDTVLASEREVEVAPYTHPTAPFDLAHEQAPRQDFITFNPVRMSQYRNCPADPLAELLYAQLGRQEARTSQQVMARMWFEPLRADSITGMQQGVAQIQRYPALVQEFTYLVQDVLGDPVVVEPGWGSLVFPVGVTYRELYDPRGYGLTTFDADFEMRDGMPLHNNLVQVYSEETLAEVTGIEADFDGDGDLDKLDANLDKTGDELLILMLENITLSLDPKDAQHPDGQSKAIFLDYMVELRNVADDHVELRVYSTKGNDKALADGSYDIAPAVVDESVIISPTYMGIIGGPQLGMKVISPPEGNRLEGDEPDGAWFVWVRDVNAETDVATIALGRALGATHSTLNSPAGGPDFSPVDPSYLKRFIVDGHEYNVVAIGTSPSRCASDGCVGAPGLTYITLRTPLPFAETTKNEASVVLQGYGWSQDSDHPRMRYLSMLPPYNLPNHSMVNNIESPGLAASGEGEVTCRPAHTIEFRQQGREEALEGEVRGMLVNVQEEPGEAVLLGWRSLRMEEKRKDFACLALSPGQPYHLTSAWGTPDQGRLQLVYEPGLSADPYINNGVATLCAESPFIEMPPPQQTPACTPRIHIVKQGETLPRIARAYGISVEALRAANGIMGDKLVKGLQLILPCRN
jgi:hypothetical protein